VFHRVLVLMQPTNMDAQISFLLNVALDKPLASALTISGLTGTLTADDAALAISDPGTPPGPRSRTELKVVHPLDKALPARGDAPPIWESSLPKIYPRQKEECITLPKP
jgi:hypothetical protein